MSAQPMMAERPAAEALLEQAASEITLLRRRCEILQAKVDTMDLFHLVLRTEPCYPKEYMGKDLVWAIRRELENMKGHAEPGGLT